MRVDFVKALDQALERDPQSVMITGDLGFNALEGIMTKFSGRFLNAGVAEQNMMGLAAGIALAGHRPWVYSIAPFTTYRCLEQIRNDVCLHHLPVRIVGNGGGYTYGIMGSTHHALEDFAALKALPNLQLFFPCANDHVAAAVRAMSELAHPAYLRLAISAYSTPAEPISENPVTLTRHYLKGENATIIGVGHGVHVALAAAKKRALCADVFAISRFPFNLESDQALVESVRRTRRVITIEEHYAAGGMGESLKATLPNTDSFDIMAARYQAGQRYGNAKFMMEQSGLTPEALLKILEKS